MGLDKARFVSFLAISGTSFWLLQYQLLSAGAIKKYTMQKKLLRNDLFLYDLAIRVLAFWTTILFSLLFFTGAEAADKKEASKAVPTNKVVAATENIQSERE